MRICVHKPGGTLLFQAGLWLWLRGEAEMEKWGGDLWIHHKNCKQTFFFEKKNSFCTHHHVQVKCVLGIEVLQLTENRKNLLLPHFNEDHFMDQHRNLESPNRKGWSFLDLAIIPGIVRVDDWQLPFYMTQGGPWYTHHAWWKHLWWPACWVSQCTRAAWTSWEQAHAEITRRSKLHWSCV